MCDIYIHTELRKYVSMHVCMYVRYTRGLGNKLFRKVFPYQNDDEKQQKQHKFQNMESRYFSLLQISYAVLS